MPDLKQRLAKLNEQLASTKLEPSPDQSGGEHFFEYLTCTILFMGKNEKLVCSLLKPSVSKEIMSYLQQLRRIII